MSSEKRLATVEILSVPEKVERMKKVASLLRQAMDLTSQGPLDYYLNGLIEHSEALLTRFSPIKIGEKAKIVKAPQAWANSATLVVGATGTIKNVDYCNGRFQFMFVPDIHWKLSQDGTSHVASEINYMYCLTEEHLEKA